jgi:imidazolonepropionase-like amidohydrolase
MVPTLVTYSAMNEMGAALGLPKRNIEKNVAILEAGLRSLEIAVSAGVTLGFGTDLIGETQSFQNRELAIRSEVQPARDILDSLWNVNARILRREGSIGVLAEGAHGDVVVSHIDPLSDIKGFARQDSIAHVVLGGNVIAAS